MGNFWALLVAPAAVLAAVLFWWTFEIQHADYEQQRAAITEQQAQHAADFSKAWNDKPDEKLEARAAEATAKREQIDAEADARKKAAAEAAARQAAELNKLLNMPATAK